MQTYLPQVSMSVQAGTPQNIAISAPLAAGKHEYNVNNFDKLNFSMSYPTRINIT